MDGVNNCVNNIKNLDFFCFWMGCWGRDLRDTDGRRKNGEDVKKDRSLQRKEKDGKGRERELGGWRSQRVI